MRAVFQRRRAGLAMETQSTADRMSIDKREEMRSKLTRDRSDPAFLEPLRLAAMIVVLPGAAGSFAFMIRAGHRNPSFILLTLFGIWVLSPFVALMLASLVSKRWSTLARTTLYTVIVVITLASLAIYGLVAIGHTAMKVGFVFLVVPLASWLLIAIAVSIAIMSAKLDTTR